MTKNGNNISLDEHPDSEDLAAVAEGNISNWIRSHVLEHVDKCESCRFVLTELASQVDKMPDLELPEQSDQPLHLKVIDKENMPVDADEDKPEAKPRPWRRPGDTFFFWIAGSFFILSMLIPSLNTHFLVAGFFFGLLAIVDYSHRNVFAPLVKAWREGDDKKAEEVIEQLKDRFKVG